MKEKRTSDPSLEKVLIILPPKIRDEVRRAVDDSALSPADVTDIRLRTGGGSYVSFGRRSHKIGADLSPEEFSELIFTLTGGSLYAHAETIREGYISVGGIRCGVCGRAVTRGGAIGEVCDISSVSIRIARDVRDSSARVFDLITRGDTLSGALIYSPPGIGKTTVLRDLIRKLSARERQIAVIDSRGELAGAAEGASADLLSGYPKNDGIICAVRSLAPELIICDELSGDDDAGAALYAFACGVPIVATAHAGTLSELKARREMASLIDSGVFRHLIGLYRRAGAEMSYIITTT